MRDLGEVALLPTRDQGVGGGAVQAGAAQRVEVAVDRLAHERVRELERTALAREQQPRVEQLVEQRLDLGGRAAGDGRQQLGVDHLPEHGGDRQQLVGLRAQPREPRADGVPDALRHRGVVVGQPAQDLLDEEGVAAGARVHGAGHAGGRLGAEPGGRELADLAGREPAQADPLGAAVAPQVGQRGGERRAAPDLRVAVGAEDEQRRRPAAAQDEARAGAASAGRPSAGRRGSARAAGARRCR